MSSEEEISRLYELADLIHGVSRQLPAPTGLEPGACTPVEITVMRFIHQNPGTSTRAASEATRLPSSNFSRALRGLERKGLIRRVANTRDARGVQLHLTALAHENFRRMRDAWSQALQGLVDDPALLDRVNAMLRRIEAELIARRTAVSEKEGWPASREQAGREGSSPRK